MKKKLHYINLHEKQKREGHVIFSAYGMMTSILVIIGGIVFFVSFQSYKSAYFQKILDKKIIEVSVSNEKLEKIISIQKSDATPEQIEKEVNEAAKIYNKKKEIFEMLKKTIEGNQTGFSDFLIALSSQWNQEMWITDFVLLEGGRKLKIEGKTIKAKEIADFIKRLSKEEKFKGMNFQKVSISKNKTEGALDFSLQSGDFLMKKNDATSSEKENLINKKLGEIIQGNKPQ